MKKWQEDILKMNIPLTGEFKSNQMKKSEKNLMVINNFILHATHYDRGDDSGDKPIICTANGLYQSAEDYIEEDHVDGKGGDIKESEVGAISAIISHNLFHKVHASVTPNEGVIGAYYRIQQLAIGFETEHAHIESKGGSAWEDHCEKIGVCDWEECIIKYVEEKISI